MSPRAKYGIERRSGGLLSAATGGGSLLAAVEEIRRAARAGLEDAAGMVMEDAKDQAPVLQGEVNLKRAGKTGGNQGGMPGELRDSAHLLLDEDSRVGIKFEGVYAAIQHEGLDLQHTEGGNAKFLERPLIDSRERTVEAIAAKIREVTGG